MQKQKSPVTLIRTTENWKLYQYKNTFIVEDPNEILKEFRSKAAAESYMISSYFKTFERPKGILLKGKHKKKVSKPEISGTMETLRYENLRCARVLSSHETIRLLQDPNSKLYYVFVGAFNSSFYSSNYQTAHNKYKDLITKVID